MFSNIQFIHISTGLHKKSQLKVCSWIESTHFGACPVQLIYFLESFEIRILKMALRGFVVMLYKVHLCLCVLRGSNALYVQLFWFLFIVSAVCDASHDHVDTGVELSENLNNISGSVILHKGLLEKLKICSFPIIIQLMNKMNERLLLNLCSIQNQTNQNVLLGRAILSYINLTIQQKRHTAASCQS